MKLAKSIFELKSHQLDRRVRVIAFPRPKRAAENKQVPFSVFQNGGETAQTLVDKIRSHQVLSPRVSVTIPPKDADLGQFLETLPPAKSNKGRFDLIDLNFGMPWSSERGEELQIVFNRDLLRRNGFFSVTFIVPNTIPRTAKQLDDFKVGSSFSASTDNEGNLIPEGLALKIMNLAKECSQQLRFCRMAHYADPEGSFDFLFRRIA